MKDDMRNLLNKNFSGCSRDDLPPFADIVKDLTKKGTAILDQYFGCEKLGGLDRIHNIVSFGVSGVLTAATMRNPKMFMVTMEFPNEIAATFMAGFLSGVAFAKTQMEDNPNWVVAEEK